MTDFCLRDSSSAIRRSSRVPDTEGVPVRSQSLRAAEEDEQMNASALFGAGVRRLVDSNIVGVLMWDLDGRILEANDAFLDMLQYGRDDLVSGGLRWTDLTPAEWRERDERATADLKSTGTVQPYEKEFLRKMAVASPC
jgi:PAS domain-containing protein